MDIFEKHVEVRERIRDYMVSRAKSKYAELWLALFSFTEASFQPIPPDFLLVTMLVAGSKRWVRLASIVTISSVLGGLFGYVLGYFAFDLFGAWVVSTYSLEHELEKVSELFQGNLFWTMFIAAFTPIPYKIFTLAGGLFQVNLLIFLISSLLGRGLRFLIVGYIFNRHGARFGTLLFKYFNTLGIGLACVVLVYIVSQFL